eukprot:TRINITY_DN30530_c0_g1_i1.p1 TRINITY_DN30530_c0_g1~~TRINITY_DN30530_c0_g1_i1.p1  ORF type:complete len:669 (+),score=140.42 TRINITY_DN30530_c0_g1_i1:105-2111(+)
MAPMGGRAARIQALVIALLGWFVVWLLSQEFVRYDRPLFSVMVLYVSAVVVGGMVGSLRAGRFKLPGLTGMLLIGCILRNTGALPGLDPAWSSALRKMALAVTLVQAGLVLSIEGLQRLKRSTVLLSFLPSLLEMTVVACTARGVLTPTFPWTWCIMLGFVVASGDPAIIVPLNTELQIKGYGSNKGIPSMVVTACGFDNVLAVTGFGIASGLTFASASTSLGLSIAHAPIDCAIGVVGGVMVGKVLSWLQRDEWVTDAFLAQVMSLSGVCLVVGFSKLNHTGGGALATLFMGVAVRRFTGKALEGVRTSVGTIWSIAAKPLLFATIGAAVDIGTLNRSQVAKGVGLLALGLFMRLSTAAVCLARTEINQKERAFVILCWLPKATVQAGLGSLALDEVRSVSPVDPTHEQLAYTILTVSVLAIVITAPLGGSLIDLCATRLLEIEMQGTPTMSATAGSQAKVESVHERVVEALNFRAAQVERTQQRGFAESRTRCASTSLRSVLSAIPPLAQPPAAPTWRSSRESPRASSHRSVPSESLFLPSMQMQRDRPTHHRGRTYPEDAVHTVAEEIREREARVRAGTWPSNASDDGPPSSLSGYQFEAYPIAYASERRATCPAEAIAIPRALTARTPDSTAEDPGHLGTPASEGRGAESTAAVEPSVVPVSHE